MKPKEVVVISQRKPEAEESLKKHGVWWFESLDKLKEQAGLSASIAAFNIAILDEKATGERSGFLHLLPNRILVPSSYNEEPFGIQKAATDLIKSACSCSVKVKGFITQTWKEWINGLLCVKNNSYDKVSLFFGQKEDENPTCGWIQLGHELNQSNIKLSLIVKTDTAKAEKPDRYSYPQHLFVFDRHFDGYREVQNDQTKMCFHAAFDKSSSDFVPIFSSTPSDIMFCQLAESAYLNILIMDERVAQVAHNEILSGEKDKPIKLYHSKKRLVVGKFSNVFIATHLKINGQDMALHTDIKKDYPRICVDVKIGRSANTRITNFKVCYHANGNETEKITPHALIIHQGVLERFFYEKVPKNPGETYKVTLKALLEDFRQFVPHILVDSGRGISPNLPDDVKFMPFSLVEDYLMKDSIAKFCLTRMLMSFVRRGANHVKQ